MPGAPAPRTAPLPLHSPPHARLPRSYNEDLYVEVKGRVKEPVYTSRAASRETLVRTLLDRNHYVWQQGPGKYIIYMYYAYTTTSGRAEPVIVRMTSTQRCRTTWGALWTRRGPSSPPARRCGQALHWLCIVASGGRVGPLSCAVQGPLRLLILPSAALGASPLQRWAP
jgi:hypothetical protein